MPEESKFAFPTDIPWRRWCVTVDSVDASGCERSDLARWQPSLSVFGYEPPSDEQPVPGLVLSFLKVSATITGYSKSELPYGGMTQTGMFYDADVDSFVISGLPAQLPCYGALLHVSVHPKQAEVSLENYPYITDVQPKKRELYELVTQTGSTLSRSLDSVNIRKGGVTSSGTEVADAGTAVDWSAIVGAAGTAGGAAAGTSVAGPVGGAVGGAAGGALGTEAWADAGWGRPNGEGEPAGEVDAADDRLEC